MAVPARHGGLLAAQLSEDAPLQPDLQPQGPREVLRPLALLALPLEPP